MEALALTAVGTIGKPAVFSADLIESYVSWVDRCEKTCRTYLVNLRQFYAWTLYQGVNEPIRKDIVSYRDWLHSEHEAIALDKESPTGWSYRMDKRTGAPLRLTCKASTVVGYLQAVKSFFAWTAENGLYPDVAKSVHSLKIDRSHKKEALKAFEAVEIEESIITKSEEKVQAAGQAVKDQAGRIQRSTEQGKRLYAIYLLSVTGGLRTVELSRLNVRDFETKGKQAWIYIWGKGHSEADAKKALAPEVAQAIREYLESRTDNPTKDSPLFVATGNRSGGKRIAPTTIGTMLKKAMVEAGFDSERLTAHSLRHTAGTTVQNMTGNIYVTQKYMRHSNPATTEIYLHMDDEEQDAEVAGSIYGFLHGQRERS